MKKILLAGAALLAIASCTNQEVVDVAKNKEIRFTQFVENNVRAVDELQTAGLTQYYVFGEFGDTEGTYGTQIFKNELQTTPYYWVASKFYSFGAYADGNNDKIENAAFDAATGKLTFTDYTPADTKDLVAAVAKMQCGDLQSAQNPVGLTFKHLLSQVRFTFNTTDAESYTLAITDLTLHAANKGTATYDANGAAWTSNFEGSETYVYDNVADVSSDDYTAQSKLVIPQSGTNELKVTFTATITGSGLDKTANFEATLAYDAGEVAGTTANTWTPGFRYNYTATINATDIEPGLETQQITFTPTVEDWQEANENTTNPSVQ